jgi:hypothetical protein
MKITGRSFFILLLILFQYCKQKDTVMPGNYETDLKFLKQHDSTLLELSGEDGNARVILSAKYQGRVMTSTASGNKGTSYGWINYKLIASGEVRKQINPIGGEERFWLGPEGGQYSLYFKGGDEFTLPNWQVPPLIDTESFEVSSHTANSVTYAKHATITNYKGTIFQLSIERKISLMNQSDIERELDINIPENVLFVGYNSENKIINAGSNNWSKEGGLLSIWLLGMFTPTDKTMVILPFHSVSNSRQFITSDYFGAIPADRLQIQDSVVFFSCDGKYRSKLGISPGIAKPIAASFDFERNILTLIHFEINPDVPYVNSKWELQQHPYQGDVVNSYNDGPVEGGAQLGPFYELESSSPALELASGEAGIYKQSTIHFEGDFSALNEMSRKILGVDLNMIKK